MSRSVRTSDDPAPDDRPRKVVDLSVANVLTAVMMLVRILPLMQVDNEV